MFAVARARLCHGHAAARGARARCGSPSASTCCSRRSACWPRSPPPARPRAALLVLALIPLLRGFEREREGRIQHSLELGRAYRGTALLLRDLLEEDDEYTGHHTEDVVELAVKVAEEMGLDEDTRRETEMGALLHDIGKIAVPDEIINKPGPLNDEEWAIMKTHTVEGERMLQQVGGLLSSVGRRRPRLARALGRRRLSRRARRRGDPRRRPHLRRLRRLQRDDHRPLLPQGAAARRSRSASCATTAAPSSRPTWSTP